MQQQRSAKHLKVACGRWQKTKRRSAFQPSAPRKRNTQLLRGSRHGAAASEKRKLLAREA
jgi:hypothetical protein